MKNYSFTDKKNKIAIDAFWLKRNRGMSKYAKNLLNVIESNTILLDPKNQFKSNFFNFILSNQVFWEQIYLPVICRIKNIDLLICPYNTRPIVRFHGTRVVAVVHDLIFMNNKFILNNQLKNSLGNIYRNIIFRLNARVNKSDFIITVSYTSKKALKSYFGQTYECVVFPNTISDNWIYKKRRISLDYILCVTGASSHKNLNLLIDAFSMLNKRHKTKLYIVGLKSDEVIKTLKNKTSKIDNNKISFLSGVSENKLIDLYVKSKFLIFPSLEEGFGIPLIEALATRTPILCSDIEVFREIAGKNAIYFNPNNVLSIKNKIEYALTNPLILKKLENKSHSFIGNYSMAKYSDLIKNYFEGMVNEDSNDYA